MHLTRTHRTHTDDSSNRRHTAVRFAAAGLVVGAGVLMNATAASALPIPLTPPGIDLDELTVETLPPVTVPPVTVPPGVIPPFSIPPVIVDPGFPTTTVPPVVPPTVPPVIVNPTTTVPPVVPPTVPPVIVNPTVPPTTVVPGTPDPEVPVDVEGESVEATSPTALASTGNDSMLAIVGLSLLGAGAVIAGGVAYDRRRKARA